MLQAVNLTSEEELLLARKANWVRRKVLDMARYAKSGHVTSAFSQTEMLVALYYQKILRYDAANPQWPDRDRFILSKGQGGIGLYPILADVGYFPTTELDNFAGPGCSLGVHCEWHVPGIETISGSLGHGLPIATGMAQVAKNDGKDWLVFCMTGDCELYEGSNWEAAFFAGQKQLNNIVVIVDRNGQGVLGYTDRIGDKRDGPGLDSLSAKFDAFGFETREINGHCFSDIVEVFADLRTRKSDKPLAIISNTVKGKGSCVMEDKRLWHYRVPDGGDMELCCAELQKACDALDAR